MGTLEEDVVRDPIIDLNKSEITERDLAIGLVRLSEGVARLSDNFENNQKHTACERKALDHRLTAIDNPQNGALCDIRKSQAAQSIKALIALIAASASIICVLLWLLLAKWLDSRRSDMAGQIADGLETKIRVLEERLAWENEAKALQAREYERRLEALNGEAERLRSMQSTYLPREVYAVEYKSLADKVDSLSRLVFIGLGALLVLEIAIRFFTH
jgi:DNA repair exonuclease SbcCD ATPase subunit